MKYQLRGLCGIGLIVLLGTSSISSLAQDPQPQVERRVLSESDRVWVEQRAATAGTPAEPRIVFERNAMQGPGPSDYIFLATEMSFGGPLVKGAPYSAQAITESTQTLIDGNRIANRSTASIYRDSEGRTRREQTLKSIGPYANGGEGVTNIYISDPVAGTSYTLDPRTQTARKMPPLRFKVAQGGATKVGQGDASLDAKASGKQYQVAIEQMNAKMAAADHATSGGVVQYRRKQTEAGIAIGAIDARNPSAKTESLGKQNIEGVEAEGTRSTVTIPAGEIGNDRPIEIVNERWYSPELQVLVMTRHIDPRFGENSYKLINISRTEPARDLFEVPAGYAVREMAGGTGVGVGAGGGTGVGGGVGTRVGASGVYSGPLNGGVLNGKAISLPKPAYPEIAKQAHASGSVTVQITIDEEGNVIAANAVAGHPLLRSSALEAARQAKFSPTKLNGEAVKVQGMLVYSFVAQ